MPRSPEHNLTAEAKETREPKVEFDWEKHVKAEWGEETFRPLERERELKTLTIEGPKGSVNVLQLVDAVPVHWKNKRNKGGKFFTNFDSKYYKSEGYVEINKFENFVDLAILLHEFGHSAQFQDNKLKQIFELSRDTTGLQASDTPLSYRIQIINRVIGVMKMFPEIGQLINKEQKEQLEKFYQLESERIMNRATLYTRNFKTEFDNYSIIKSEQQKIIESLNYDLIEEIADLPLKILERDATARALKWLREISNQTGIDFFKKFKIEKPLFDFFGLAIKPEKPPEFDEEEESELLDNCQRSIQEGMANPDKFVETDVVQEMNAWLKTYHAKSLTDTYDPARTGKRIKPKL